MQKLIGALSAFACLSVSVPAFAQHPTSVSVVPNKTVAPNAVAPAVDADQAALERLKPAIKIAEDWLRRPELQRSYVGLEIMDVPSGRIIFSHNGRKRFVSASIAKVLTTSCAYDTFGGAYTYKTDLVGYGEVRGARLYGPLVIMPSQDPTFTMDNLRELLGSVQGKLKNVNGTVLVSSVPGGGDHFGTEWLVQDWGQDWMPVSSDLIVDRNVVPGRDPGRGLPLVTVAADSVANAMERSLLQSPWAPAWVQYNRGIGNVSYYRPDQAVTGGFCVANPTEFNAAVARAILKNQGIKVENHSTELTEQPIPFGQHQSKPLSEIIRFTLKESDNLYAQQLLRTLGTQVALNKSLENATLEDRGLARLNAWLSSVGVPAGDAVVFDGCGLSRKNAIAPHALNVVLRHMAGPTGAGPYIDLMIHEGEGNARNFRYKTGAMDSVRSISGIVRTSTGQPIAVTVIVNDHTPSVRELRPTLNALIAHLESLGSVKLSPAVEAPVHHAAHPRSAGPTAGKAVAGGRKHRGHGRRR